MTKRYFLSFSSMAMVHLLILIVSWKVTQTETFRSQVQKLGNGAIKLQMAGKVMSSSSVAVQRKVERHVRESRKSIPVASAVADSVPSTSEATTDVVGPNNTQGSLFGTAKKGLVDPKSLYKAEVRAMIEKHKFYPTTSKRLGQTGTVVIVFTLLEDGKITDLKIAQASRYENLNASALDAVKRVERFKPIPKEFGESKIEFKVPINFKTI